MPTHVGLSDAGQSGCWRPSSQSPSPSCSSRHVRRQPGVADSQPSATANTFSLRSPDVADGGTLPKEFTGDGEGVTPPLEWTNAPAGTRSYALIMHHTDAQNVTFSYWILYNIPADVQSLPKDVKGIGTLGLSSRGNHMGYTPPHSAGPGSRPTSSPYMRCPHRHDSLCRRQK